jgi:hypothetical protein
MRYTYEQIKEILRRAGWPEELVPFFAAVALQESSGNPRAAKVDAIEESYGLFQINVRAHPQYRGRFSLLFDPVQNARIALQIYRQQGFSAWLTTIKNGLYRRYLGDPIDESKIVDPRGRRLSEYVRPNAIAKKKVTTKKKKK